MRAELKMSILSPLTLWCAQKMFSMEIKSVEEDQQSQSSNGMVWLIDWLIDCVCAVTRELGGIPSDGIDRHNWTVHLVRIAHPLPNHDWALILLPGPIQPWPIQPLCGLGGCVMGCHHYCALLPACDLPGDGSDTELYTRGRRRRLRLDHVFLACERPEMVQGPTIQHRHFSRRQQERQCVTCSKPHCIFLIFLHPTF